MKKSSDFVAPEKVATPADDKVDVIRRESLGRLVKYTAPALLALLLSSENAAAVSSSITN